MSIMPCVVPTRESDREKTTKGTLIRKQLTSTPLCRHLETQTFEDLASDLKATSFFPGSSVALKDPPSPISSLVEELLVMVFDDVVISESSTRRGIRAARRRLSSPRNLACVSRAWKTVVFAYPKLWRYVHLTPVQSIHALKEQLRLASPLSIHLIIHQWPTPATGRLSITALAEQLQSIMSPSDGLATADQRVESITIDAFEHSIFLNFVLHLCTGTGFRFPALRHVVMNSDMCATWSRTCFFDGRNAPNLERLELNNVALAHNAHTLSWGAGLNLTTLVWSASANEHASFSVSVSCFHHILSSFPSLTTLELSEHVVALEFANWKSLEGMDIMPLTHVRDLRVSGRVFSNSRSAYVLFYLLPSVGRLVVRGMACAGPLETRTVTLALDGLTFFSKELGWPTVLPNVDDLRLECTERVSEEWRTWCMGELERWKQWRETIVAHVMLEDVIA